MNRAATVEDKGARSRAAVVLRAFVVALAPPLVVFACEMTVFASLGARWLLMTAAVIVSAANGGMATGLLATMTGAALIWWFLIPPVHTLGAIDPSNYLSISLFLAVGYAVSLLHERLRRTTDRLVSTARQNQIFAAVIENSVDFIGIADPSGNPLYLNAAGRRMIQLPNNVDVERTQIIDYYPPERRAFAVGEILEAMRARGSWAGETCFRNWRTGAAIPVLDTHFLVRDSGTGQVIALATITRDISVQKAQRDALERSANDLRIAQRLARMGSWHWNAITGEVEWSDELYRIFRLDTRQKRPPTQRPSAELLTAESLARATEALEKARTTGAPYDLELEIVRHDGSRGWIASRGEVIRDADGRIVGLDGTVADITQRKELQRLRDEWTSVIAHDLRQPIGAIMMASDFLSEVHSGEMSEPEQAFIQRIGAAARTLRRMVDDLLDMSLLEANRLKLECGLADPRELVSETIQQLAHIAGIERVRVSAQSEAVPIPVDRMRIEQVLSNLITNAIKYGDEQTDITIDVRQRPAEIEIAVTNRGHGIAREEIPRLFDRFARSRTTRGSGVPGLGLGLYISKGIVEAHGGRLWAESTPGECTTFHVVLPMSARLREAA